MIKWLADATPCTSDIIDKWHMALTCHGLCVDTSTTGVLIGLEHPVERLSIGTIQILLKSLVDFRGFEDVQLTWHFSGQSLALSEIGALLAAWVQENDLPLLAIIKLDLFDRVHKTRGLAAFVGYECAVHFETPQQSRDAAINLGLLARRVLLDGGLDSVVHYQGFGGQPLTIEWRLTGDAEALVIITLPTVQNGSAFH